MHKKIALCPCFTNTTPMRNGRWFDQGKTSELPCMILAEAPRPNRPKKDESVLHMMSFFCVLLRVFDAFCAALGGLFLLHRVGHWWCAICFWCSFSPGNSYWAEDLVWRWNAQGPSPYDRVERHRWLSLLCETGPPACHEIWGSDNRITEYVSNCWYL